jgi:hypothetical protein
MMTDRYCFDKTPEDAEMETPIEDFSDALYAAGGAVASTILGPGVVFATVCPGWSARYGTGPEPGTPRYRPSDYISMVRHEDEPTNEDTDESIREQAVRNAVTRMACWLALGEDAEDAPYDVFHYIADACEWPYYRAGGFGPEPEIDWPEDWDSAEYERADAAHAEWYIERARMFWELVVYKATDVVIEHYEAIERVAVSLCYQGTPSGSQVAEIVERVEGAERSAAQPSECRGLIPGAPSPSTGTLA